MFFLQVLIFIFCDERDPINYKNYQLKTLAQYLPECLDSICYELFIQVFWFL